MRVGVGAEARTSKTALKIRYKCSLEYLGTLVATGKDFGLKGLLGYLENSDLKGRKKSGGVTEGAIEECSRRGQPRPWIEIILVQTFF